MHACIYPTTHTRSNPRYPHTYSYTYITYIITPLRQLQRCRQACEPRADDGDAPLDPPWQARGGVGVPALCCCERCCERCGMVKGVAGVEGAWSEYHSDGACLPACLPRSTSTLVTYFGSMTRGAFGKPSASGNRRSRTRRDGWRRPMIAATSERASERGVVVWWCGALAVLLLQAVMWCDGVSEMRVTS